MTTTFGFRDTEFQEISDRYTNDNAVDVLRFIRVYWDDHHFSPTFGEIGKAMGFSERFARRVVDRLCVEAYCTRDVSVHRSIYVLPAGMELLKQADAVLKKQAGRPTWQTELADIARVARNRQQNQRTSRRIA